MQRTLLYILFLTVVMAIIPYNGSAKDNKKKKKEAVVKTFEPSPISSRAKPDTHAPNVRYPKSFSIAHTRDHTHNIEGIDVSHYQHTINWKDVAKSQIPKYAYMKATEGTSIVDDTYAYNIKEARKHGIKAGSYHFFRPEKDPAEQYKNFINTIKIKEQDLLPIVDIETFRGIPSHEVFHQRILTFCKLLTKAFNGQKPIIYTGKNFYEQHLASCQELQKYKFMIAAYQDNEPVLSDGKKYLIWQYSSKGRINGIKGNVDRSRFVEHFTLSDILVQ